MKRKLTVALALVMICMFQMPAYAGTPRETVQANVNRVLEILRDPQLKAASAKELKKEKLRTVYNRMFDDVELAKRTLARNWNQLNVAQRQEFTRLFRQVLEKAYADKILSYTNERIVFDRETKLAENRSEVQTRIMMASKEIPIAYRVILKDGDWKVYDVVIENVSLVLNYRTQFNGILAKNTPEQLLEILRKKVKDQKS